MNQKEASRPPLLPDGLVPNGARRPAVRHRARAGCRRVAGIDCTARTARIARTARTGRLAAGMAAPVAPVATVSFRLAVGLASPGRPFAPGKPPAADARLSRVIQTAEMAGLLHCA